MSQSNNLSCINRIKDELDKYIKDSNCDDPNLASQIAQLSALTVNFEDLRDSKIGQVVNNIRKSTSDAVLQKTCKNLIKKWYLLVNTNTSPNDENLKSNNCKDAAASKSQNESTSQDGIPDQQSLQNKTANVDAFSNKVTDNNIVANKGSSSEASISRKRSVEQLDVNSNEEVEESPTNSDSHRASLMNSINKKIIDPVRKACLAMLLNSLDKNSESTSKINPILAEEIEQAIYDLFKISNIKYKNCVRSRVFNLKDTSNTLCNRVVSGQIMPQELAKMTSEEMASESLKKINHQIHLQAVDQHSLAKAVGTYADSFKCGKCGKKNCTYSQAQIRSSDEPMTTFVTCMECGNRWKFN